LLKKIKYIEKTYNEKYLSKLSIEIGEKAKKFN